MSDIVCSVANYLGVGSYLGCGQAQAASTKANVKAKAPAKDPYPVGTQAINQPSGGKTLILPHDAILEMVLKQQPEECSTYISRVAEKIDDPAMLVTSFEDGSAVFTFPSGYEHYVECVQQRINLRFEGGQPGQQVSLYSDGGFSGFLTEPQRINGVLLDAGFVMVTEQYLYPNSSYRGYVVTGKLAESRPALQLAATKEGVILKTMNMSVGKRADFIYEYQNELPITRPMLLPGISF